MPGSRRKEPRKEGPEGWRQEVWSIQGWEPDTSRFSFSRRKSNRFFDDLRKGFPVYLDPKNQNTFVFSRDSGGPSRSSVCLNLESVWKGTSADEMREMMMTIGSDSIQFAARAGAVGLHGNCTLEAPADSLMIKRLLPVGASLRATKVVNTNCEHRELRQRVTQ